MAISEFGLAGFGQGFIGGMDRAHRWQNQDAELALKQQMLDRYMAADQAQSDRDRQRLAWEQQKMERDRLADGVKQVMGAKTPGELKTLARVYEGTPVANYVAVALAEMERTTGQRDVTAWQFREGLTSPEQFSQEAYAQGQNPTDILGLMRLLQPQAFAGQERMITGARSAGTEEGRLGAAADFQLQDPRGPLMRALDVEQAGLTTGAQTGARLGAEAEAYRTPDIRDALINFQRLGARATAEGGETPSVLATRGSNMAVDASRLPLNQALTAESQARTSIMGEKDQTLPGIRNDAAIMKDFNDKVLELGMTNPLIMKWYRDVQRDPNAIPPPAVLPLIAERDAALARIGQRNPMGQQQLPLGAGAPPPTFGTGGGTTGKIPKYNRQTGQFE